MKESVYKMWRAFKPSEDNSEPVADFFCDNKVDADECAQLVSRGIKQATAGLLSSWEQTGRPLPKVGDLFLVTNWEGEAVCVVKTTKVSIQPFSSITTEQAFREGEGDKSLGHWRKVHREFFERELAQREQAFEENMMIVFEEFEKVFPE